MITTATVVALFAVFVLGLITGLSLKSLSTTQRPELKLSDKPSSTNDIAQTPRPPTQKPSVVYLTPSHDNRVYEKLREQDEEW